jgi:hypothetical protein
MLTASGADIPLDDQIQNNPRRSRSPARREIHQMNFKAALSVLLVSLVASGGAGCKKETPTGPDLVRATSTVPPANRLPIATAAPYLAQTINNVIEGSLTHGLNATGAGRWTKNCPAGGDAKIELPANYTVLSGGVIMLDHDVLFTDCATDTNVNALQPFLSRLFNWVVTPLHAQAKARIVGRGRLRTKGKWRPPIMSNGRWTYRDEPVRATGSLDVSQTNCAGGTCPSQIGPIQLDCGIDGSVCAGSIGGVGVSQGPADTPPPPNPTSTTTTTIPSSGISLTGNWTEAISSSQGTQTRTVRLSQSGSSISGSADGISITGSVSGSSVTLFETQTISAQGASCTITVRHALQASNSLMTGTWTSTMSCVGVPVPTASDSGTARFTKQ